MKRDVQKKLTFLLRRKTGMSASSKSCLLRQVDLAFDIPTGSHKFGYPNNQEKFGLFGNEECWERKSFLSRLEPLRDKVNTEELVN
ncbi:hypothetical protein Trydic_g963 [Trypoxylus dichotomus]